MPAKEKWLRRSFLLGSCICLVCPPCPSPVYNGGCISCCRAGAGGAGFWPMPPRVGHKPPQIHLRSFPSPLGCPGAVVSHCKACEKPLSSTGQVLTVRMVKTLTIAEPNASGPCWDRSIPNQAPFFGFASILLYPPHLWPRVCRQTGYRGQAPSSEMGRATGEEWGGAGGTKSSSFFCSVPHGFGVRGSSAELVGEHWGVRWQRVIFPPLLHGLHLFSACPFQQGEQFGYTLPAWQSVL